MSSRPSNQSLDSSLGLLKGDAMTDLVDFDASKENLEPNISLGRYLQPAFEGSPLAAETSVSSQPLSDSEEEDVALPTSVPTMIPSESFEFTPPAPVLPQSVQPSPEQPSFSDASIASMNGFSWDKVVQANTADNDVGASFKPQASVY